MPERLFKIRGTLDIAAPHKIDFGQSGDSRYPLITSILNRHVPIGENTVTAIRRGVASGKMIDFACFAADILEKPGSLMRTYDVLYNLLRVGIDSSVRTNLRNPPLSHRFNSEHYIDRFAEAVNEHPKDLSSILEAVRCVCVYMLKDKPELELYFDEMVKQLYQHMLTPAYSVDPRIKAIKDSGIIDPVEWFKALYSNPERRRWLGKLTPYEIGLFIDVFDYLRSHTEIDQFSKNLLEFKKKHKGKPELIRQVREEIGIPIGLNAIQDYFHVLYRSETTVSPQNPPDGTRAGNG